jgi:hypothetical protein
VPALTEVHVPWLANWRPAAEKAHLARVLKLGLHSAKTGDKSKHHGNW